MRAFPVFASVTLLAVAFAGCLGGETEAPPVRKADAPATDETGLENVTNDDGSDVEMGADLGHQPHIHDYWKDRERVTLMDQDVTVDAPSAVFWTFIDTVRGTPGVGGAFIQLPEGQIVYEGTGKLEFTATWSDATVTGMGLSYRTPAEPQFSENVALSSGVPLVVEVTPEMSDMPHAKTSRWQFLVSPAQPGQVIAGKFHVKIDVVRMRDVEVFPGHPELFQGASSLTIFEGPGTSSQDNVAMRIVNRVQQRPEDDSVAAQKVVPMETRSMTANLTLKAATAEIGKASRAHLLVKPADRNNYAFVQSVAVDEATQTYQFAWMVEMQMTDSPYASESDWRFMVFVETDPTGTGMNACGGCFGAKVDYDLLVVAYPDVVEGSRELRFGRMGGG